MPPVKTPEERGPTAWWAYRTRDRIDMSVEQVVALLPTPTDTSTLRKAEGDSRNMSRRLLRELGDLYRREYRTRGRSDYQEPPGAEARRPDGDQAAVVAAIREQTDVLRQLVSAVSRLDESVAGGMIGLGDALGAMLAGLGGSLPRSAPAPAGLRDPDAPENGTPSIPRRGVR